ncbi:hypothetical protein C0989_004820 [Termitomyces sp. Mn162]|nr:hypothetical protein C0989_004820 [Termitomyces sp. Mn162]
MDDLTAGMTVSAPAVASASDTTKHLVGALAVVRGKGQSEGHRGEEAVNRGDIQEAGLSTPKAVAGSVARGLVTSPRLATTLRSKGKGKGKARDKEDEDIEDQIEEMFTDKCLAALLCWQKALTVVDTGLGAGVKLEKAKGKVTVSLEKRQEYKHMQGVHKEELFAQQTVVEEYWQQRELAKQEEPIEVKHSSLTLPTLQEEAVVGGSGGAKVKSREVVESDKDDSNNDSDGNMPLAWK